MTTAVSDTTTTATSEPEPIRPRDRAAIPTSLRAGVVPRTGFQHLQVGRTPEVTALTEDLTRIADGGSAVRFLIGDYGAGKTFLLSLIGAAARHRKLVTVYADLNPDRRLQSSGGQARSLYAELMRNLATRAQPDGGALEAVVERFITTCHTQARAEGTTTEEVIARRLGSLTELTGGYDFAARSSGSTGTATTTATTMSRRPQSAGSAPSTRPRATPAPTSACAPSSTTARSTTASSCSPASSAAPASPGCWSASTSA